MINNSGTLNICDCNNNRQNSVSNYVWDEATNALKTADTITVQGGVITGGNVPAGGSNVGGDGICNLGTLHMYSGTIAGNRVATFGGGVHNLGSVILYGGTITKNLAGNNGAGVFVGEGETVSLTGNTEIYDNINTSKSANFYVDLNIKLKVMGTLHNTHPIGINIWTPGVFTENGSGVTGKISDRMARFTSDNDNYRVIADDTQH